MGALGRAKMAGKQAFSGRNRVFGRAGAPEKSIKSRGKCLKTGRFFELMGAPPPVSPARAQDMPGRFIAPVGGERNECAAAALRKRRGEGDGQPA
jgi:hypothetical protein